MTARQVVRDDRPETNMSRLAQRCRAAAEEEGVQARALFWRGKSESERSAAFVGLMRMSDYAARHRPRPYEKSPLDFPRFSSTGQHDAAP
ncbi:MAG: hypothetical protein C0506_01535 [Anaerolinea sp.]|nr:hypothetical protein [Anaerolinea sp.]